MNRAMDEVDVKGSIRRFVLSTSLSGESAGDLTDTIPLRTSGILDSFATMELVTFLAQEFGVELTVHDMALDRFNRIDDMAAVVIEKRRDAQSR
jgi:acyl carrier protein